MKQLYKTYCRDKVGLENRSGEQLRAASIGMNDQHMQRLSGLMGYDIPKLPLEQLSPETAPVRLAFLATDEEGDIRERALVQARYVGEDPASGRMGAYFAHLITDLPPDVTARQAIRAWRSPHWVARDDGGPKELPDVGQLPVGPLDDAALFTFVAATASHLDAIAFLAHALLIYEAQRTSSGAEDGAGPTDRKPIFLVATPDDAAMLLYGALRILPPIVVKQMTFSVYDRIDELLTTLTAAQVATTVTATWRPQNPTYDLPDRHYTGVAMSLNMASGRRSSLSAQPALLTNAIASLAGGDLSAVDAFHRLCADLRLSSLEMVELAFALSQGKSSDALTMQEMRIVAQAPALALYLATQDGFFVRLVALAREEQFRNRVFAPILDALRERADLIASLAEVTVVAGDHALLADELATAKVYFKALLPAIDPQIAHAARQQLIPRMAARLAPDAPRDRLSMSARQEALSLSGWDTTLWDADRTREWVERWVNLTPQEAPEWLLQAYPTLLRQRIAWLALTTNTLTTYAVAYALRNTGALLLRLYLDLARDGQDELARRLLVAFAPPPARAPNPNAPQESRLQQALQLMITAPDAEAQAGLLAAGPLLEEIGANITVETFEQADYALLIYWVDHHRPLIPEQGLTKAMQNRYWAWDRLHSFLWQPHFSPNVMTGIPLAFQALDDLPEPARARLKHKVIVAIARYLAGGASAPGTANGKSAPQTAPLAPLLTRDQQLETLRDTLVAWGPELGGSAMTWYCDMLMEVATWPEPRLVGAMAPILFLLGLQDANPPAFATVFQPEDLVGDIEDTVRSLERSVIDVVTRAARTWPEAARERWQDLLASRQTMQISPLDGPRDLWRRLRSRTLGREPASEDRSDPH